MDSRLPIKMWLEIGIEIFTAQTLLAQQSMALYF